MKKGFTLIELLVVVLIIGILSSVALPQYEKSVEKARAAEALGMVRAIRDAQQVYYMANGSYSNRLEDLDIGVPGQDGGIVSGTTRRQSKYFSYGGLTDTTGAIAVANRLPFSTFYSIGARTDGFLYCRSYSSKGEMICKSFGGNKVEDNVYRVK
ncbi:MAG: prepilin-type N-terminal cleavage/methylation domain-containing protein [Elusimicrobiaceae bacterium]|nr:prepilin-type N-terminal cleavage/methylation domain-containing protein [Elusimicrobiaceae bacterium]